MTEQCSNCIYYRRLKHNFELRKGFEDSNCCIVWTKIEDGENAFIVEVDEYDMCEMFTSDTSIGRNNEK